METPTEEKKEPEKEEADEKQKDVKKAPWSHFFAESGLLAFFQAIAEYDPNADWLPSKEEYIRLKAREEGYKRNNIMVIALIILLIFVIPLLISLFSKHIAVEFESYMNQNDVEASEVSEALKILTLVLDWISVISMSFGCFHAWHRWIWATQTQQRIRTYELTYVQEQAQEDPFKNSIKTSYKYLDRYYDQTQKQAQKGFAITVFIAVCGAALIFVGVIAMYFGFIQPAYIICASGAITELISAIFFYLYNKTVTSMSRYHNKLVLSQNISFALRVADSLTEKKKDAAKLEIIKELVKDVNAQMMKSDNDDTEPPKKKQSDAEKPSETGTQS